MTEGARPPEGAGDAGHVPVLLSEVMKILDPFPGMRVLDGTLGMGGHAAAILERIRPKGRLLGIDRDEDALERARRRLERVGGEFHLYRGVFSRIEDAFSEAGWEAEGGLDGVLLDLGVSSYQLDTPERGFSFQREGPLDMRMSAGEGEDARSWLRSVSREELVRVLKEYGEEPAAARIAREIERERRAGGLETTAQLADLVARVSPRAGRKTHPATRTFQAIRIAVNRELQLLEDFLKKIDRYLAPGGRVVILSYHSLEDRLVKSWLRRRVQEGIFERVEPEWIRPGAPEVKRNPRARSARLRWAKRRGERPAR